MAGNIRKAATLLTMLDPATAAELLRSARPETITQIVAEVAFLRQPGNEGAALGPIKEFFGMVAQNRKGAKVDFVQEVVESAVGKGKSPEIMLRISELLEMKDPFRTIREMPVADIAKALVGEPPPIATMVLAEMAPKKAAQLLPLLEEPIRAAALQGMTQGLEVSPEARTKVAQVIRRRLDDFNRKGETAAVTSQVTDRRGQQLRRVAVLLRGLETSLRDVLLASIVQNDAATADAVSKLMVIWDDLPLVGDKAIQGIMRGVDSRKLALALMNTSPTIAKKIRSNISERASAMLDEEAALLSNAKAEEIEQAREAILDSLRELNKKGELPLAEA